MSFKKPRALFVCGAVIFTLLFVGYFFGYQIYTQHSQQLASLNLQNQNMLKKHLNLQDNLAKLAIALKDLKTANRQEKNNILSKINVITEKLQNWKAEYAISLNTVKKDIADLTRVDLGKISVDKKIPE